MKAILFLFSLLLVNFSLPVKHQVHIQLLNKCPFTVWPAVKGKLLHQGFSLKSGKIEDIYVPTGWHGQVWARTHCDNNMVCATGYCGAELRCEEVPPKGPVSTAFLHFNRAGSDYYWVSLEDGHNLPISIKPISPMALQNCTTAGQCSLKMNIHCPDDLRLEYNGTIIGCMSACERYREDRYCCTGGFDSMFECNERSWPSPYPQWFKGNCPKALTFKYDWESYSIYACNGAGTNTTYQILFC